MTDLSQTIIAKSDQLNADDLIGRTITVKITNVKGRESADQPIDIHYEGDNGKPYKPCKSMRRVLVYAWGPDGKAYVGRSMTLHRDPEVKFGGIAVGGIRISHMSHIDGPMQFPLTATRGSKKLYTVKPLVQKQEKPPAPEVQPENPLDMEEWYTLQNDINKAETLQDLEKVGEQVKAITDRMTTEQKNEIRLLYGNRGKFIRSQEQ